MLKIFIVIRCTIRDGSEVVYGLDCTSTVTLSNIGVVAWDADGAAALAPVGLLFDLIDAADALLLALDPLRELSKNKRPNHSVNFSNVS